MSSPTESTETTEPAHSPKAGWLNPLWAGAIVVGLFIVSQLIAAIIVSGLTSLVSHKAGAAHALLSDAVLSQFVYIFFAEGIVLASLGLIFRGRGLSWRDVGIVRPKWFDPIYALLAFGAYISAYLILLAVVSPLVPGLNVSQKQDIGFNGATGLVSLSLVFLALVALAPFTEEVLMRGFFFGSLRRHLPFWVSSVLTSLLFASLHLGGGEQGSGPLWIAAIDTFILSLALCYLRERTGRLWASIGLHALKNCIAFVALFILTGGS